MNSSIGELDSKALMDLVSKGELDDLEVLQVLRNPFCTSQIAEAIASDRRFLSPHGVRELLAGFPGLNFARAADFLGTLPWASLLTLAKAPKTPPVVRRHAERKLLSRLPSMVLGEKIALARRAHRALFPSLTATGDGQVLVAMLDNPRLVENDILVIVNTNSPPHEFLAQLARHGRWGTYRGIRRAVVEAESTPLPLALSVLVQLPATDLRQVLAKKSLPPSVRSAALSLLDREARGERGVINSSGG